MKLCSSPVPRYWKREAIVEIDKSKRLSRLSIPHLDPEPNPVKDVMETGNRGKEAKQAVEYYRSISEKVSLNHQGGSNDLKLCVMIAERIR